MGPTMFARFCEDMFCSCWKGFVVTPIEKRKAELSSFIEVRKKANNEKWKISRYDGGLDIFADDEVGSYISYVNLDCGNRDANADFIVLAANHAERMAYDLLKALDALDIINDAADENSAIGKIVKRTLDEITKGPGGV